MFALKLEDDLLKSSLMPLIKLALYSLDVPVVVVADFAGSHPIIESSSPLQKPRLNDVIQQLSGIIEDTGEAPIIDDSMTQPPSWKSSHAPILQAGIRAIAGVSIQSSDSERWGVLIVLDDEPHQWTAHNIELISHIADAMTGQIETGLKHRQQHKQIETLKNSENLFQQLAHTSTDALVILDEEARITYCNSATADIFGYSLSELIQQPVEILTDGSIHNSMDGFMLQAFDQYQRTADWKGLRLTGRHKNGADIPIELTLDMIQTKEHPLFKLIVRDVSRQVMVEEELRSDRARYLQILDAIPDLVYVKDASSRLIWANKSFQKFFDMSLSELTGKLDAGDITDSQRLINLQLDSDVFEAGKELRRDEEGITRHDGVKRDFVTTKIPIFDNRGNPELLVAVSTDITDAKNLERYLTTALEKNQELVTLKSDFISMVSHEFRTPLSVIQSSVDIITTYYERLSDERRFQKLKTVEQQVSRLTKLMDDVLLVSQGDATGMPFNPSPHDIDALSRSIIEEIEVNYKESTVSIDYAVHGDCKNRVIDSNLYRHIFQNLLSNAVKYSRPGTEANVRLTCSDTEITLVVTDKGIGIPAENQANLFLTFHRANNVGTIQGTGLGLAIVKRAVDTHGGTINFKSIENEGTMFIVKLPVGTNT